MNKLRATQGFTLIELLIVVVIIGILAAIAIPQFSSTKEKAFDSAAKSDLRNMMTTEEGYFADNQTYASANVGAGAGITTPFTFQASQGVAVDVTGAASTYTATAAHQSSSSTFCINTDPASTSAGKIVSAANC